MREGDRFLRTSDGGEVCWRIDGPLGPADAPLMLVYNGLVSSPMHWRFWVSHYARHCRVLTWHYPGHGPDYSATCDLRRVGIAEFAEVGHELIAAAGGGPAIIAGISMGVQATLEHMRAHAGDARGLVLLCGTYGHPLNRLGGGESVRRMLITLIKTMTAAPTIARAILAPFVATPLGRLAAYATGGAHREHLPPEFLPELFAHVQRLDPRVIGAIVGSWAEHSAEDLLPGIRVPTLVFAGGADDLTPPSLAQTMCERIPDCEVHVVPGHSHLLQVERPDLVHRITDDWIARKLSAAPVAKQA